MLSKHSLTIPTTMSFDTARKMVSYLINTAVASLVNVGVHTAAIGSALYVFTQLLPEENMVLDDYVYDAQAPLETSEDGKLFKCACSRLVHCGSPKPYMLRLRPCMLCACTLQCVPISVQDDMLCRMTTSLVSTRLMVLTRMSHPQGSAMGRLQRRF